MEYTLTQHAKERYVERVKGITHPGAVRDYIEKHSDEIKHGLEDMLSKSELLYQGLDLSSNPREVYLTDFWLILIDTKRNCIVTLYKVDFGVGEDFDREFIKRYRVKLRNAIERMETTEAEVQAETQKIRECISGNNAELKKLNALCSQLQEQNTAYNTLITNLDAKNGLAQHEVKTILKELLGKRVF